MANEYDYLVEKILPIVKQAGGVITQIYEKYKKDSVLEVEKKADETPITEADWQSHDLFIKELTLLTPDIPILSEESAAIPYSVRREWPLYWLLDPLDGTRDFLEMTDEFTINLALVNQHSPVIGIIYAPITKTCYFATPGEAFKQIGDGQSQAIKCSSGPLENPRIVVSRHHGRGATQQFLEKFGSHQIIHCGSALKFGLIAEGVADIYPRLGPTSEWDTAAGQCIVEAAGGCVLDFNAQALRYNASDSLLNPNFIALADPKFMWQQLF